MHYDKVILGFAEELVPSVLDGTKTLTYRLGEKYDFLEKGDTFLIENSANKQPFAEIELLFKERTTFRELPLDRAGHEPYASKNEQKQTFEMFYHRTIEGGGSDPYFRLCAEALLVGDRSEKLLDSLYAADDSHRRKALAPPRC